MPTVELRHGDMFDGPSDMVVLPCSTNGTITGFVRQKLLHFRIPYPKPGMELGEVSILPFEGGENIAQYVAYAASVLSNTSTPEAIKRIGEQIGDYTNMVSSVRHICAPLLGAGAGGLTSELVVSSLSDGFKKTASQDASLVINVLHKEVFDRINISRKDIQAIRTTPPPLPAPEERPPRVFISYTHSSPEHMKWVERLGTFLRENGVDARVDVWHLRRGMDLPQFMTNELALSDRVIIVSDERYAEKADGRVGGVGWETMIVQGDMAQLPPDNTKYLVVVRAQQLDSALPRFLKTKFVIHWPDSSVDSVCHTILLRELFNQVVIPPIGNRPLFI